MQTLWIENIKLYYNVLTITERNVADFLIKYWDDIGSMTIRECSDGANVGQPTVVRCLKKCRLGSWKEFQHRVWQDSNYSSLENKYDKIHSNEIPIQTAQKAIEMVVSLTQNLDLKEFHKMIQILKKAKTIDIYGVERSAGVAMDLAGKLLYLGLQCRNYPDLYYQKIGAENLSNKDVAIAISQSGETKVVIDSLISAGKRGAKTVAITGNKNAELAKYADFVFITPSFEDKKSDFLVSSRVAQTVIVDMIYTSLMNSDVERFEENLSRSEKNIYNNE